MYSVIVTVHNGESFIAAALESIFAQTLRPVEVIVVNDSSKDNTDQILLDFKKKISIIKCEEQNQSVALNIGICHAKSEFIAFLDHDDLWVAEKQEEQIEILKASGADCVSGGVSNFHLINNRKYFGPARVFGATTFRRASFKRVGLLDESIKHHAIFEWWSRASVYGLHALRLDREHLLRRIHNQNSGIAHKPESRRALLEVIRAHMRRG